MEIRDRIKDFRRCKAKTLLPNPRNWRTHPDEQQNAVRGVLAEVGIADALIARELPDGRLRLVDGHLRADIDGDTEWPVLILDITDEEEEKILTTLDPLAAMATVDKQKLGELLHRVETDNEALQSLLDELAADNGIDLFDEETPDVSEPEPQVDRADELQKEWGTELGQIWLIKGTFGSHRLVCGDSSNPDDVAKLLDGAEPFLMITDPPYGVDYDPKWRQRAGVNKNALKMGEVQNDDQASWQPAWDLFPGTVAYVWHGGLHATTVAVDLIASGFQLRSQIIWAKERFALSRGHYHWQHEPCWYASRGTANWAGDRKQSTVCEITSREDSGHGHSTQKPVECMHRPIMNHEAAEVYDPFVGSGTTFLAAEKAKRNCYGMELSPGYCAVILQRMKDAGLEVTQAEQQACG